METLETRILIVEDEEKIARFVELELEHEGYVVEKASNGREGLEMAQNREFSLMLLDVMLPELNGLEVLRRLRKTSNLPVIMLTARDAVMDKVSGLDSGADDYITKPFAIEELLARIRTALKKHQSSANQLSTTTAVDSNLLECNNVTLNETRHQVKVNDKEVELTNREFTLLQVLLENKDIVLSRDTLLEKVCGYDYMGETNVIDVYVRYLRSKIDDTFGIKLIHTIRGVGYMIKSDV
ncbi:response regulator transcription factor [[Clostridium] fimetarium]|uniref:Stage 0 sporulation protein A homolog n=1 Tax=[Clostridium] fimetarium TaxID=99656 RepID=A0A1I0NKW7_9FIRM|nr:response regulator transcription factor [[Clostridium] fimetarium]SEW02119.1 DNA-binding response regulator, OmpR family, contains REC and winged-helix (wHTH) domain [[Clostridium] fimetarium]